MHDIGTSNDLAVYRVSQARQCLNSARLLADAGDFKASANRSYYCIFHCMRAVLATCGFDSKKHSGIISEFRKRFIKTGIFDSSFSDVIGSAFDLRSTSDYSDFYIVPKSDVYSQIDSAEMFLVAVEAYLQA